MAAALNRIRRPMACHFKLSRCSIFLPLLLSLIVSGCVSFRFDRASQGAEVPRPTAELQNGKTTLTEVLAFYGAPTEVVDMQGKFALLYKKSFYQGGQISFGIPLSDVFMGTNLKMDAFGNLLRHDLLAFFFTPDGVLTETKYERGASYPFWGSFWK
jgi:hypothetical protein